jgi:hypothetical protein
VFVAALGHPYGPNAERGIFRSTDGGARSRKCSIKNEYVSGNDVRIDPERSQHRVRGDVAAAAELHRGRGFAADRAVERRRHLQVRGRRRELEAIEHGTAGILQANLAIAPGNPKVIYATVACIGPCVPPATGAGGAAGAGGAGAAVAAAAVAGGGAIGFFKTIDGGDHWFLATDDPRVAEKQSSRIPADQRPLGRIGGGDLPTVTVDSKERERRLQLLDGVLAHGRRWRDLVGGARRAGGDDYQKSWINPDNSNILAVVADQGGVVSGQSRRVVEQLVHAADGGDVSRDRRTTRFRTGCAAASRTRVPRAWTAAATTARSRFRTGSPVNIQEYGIAAPDPKNPDLVFGSQRTGVSLYNRKTGRRPRRSAADVRGAFGRNVRTMPLIWSPSTRRAVLRAERVFKSIDHGHSWTRISGDLTRQTWAVPASVRQVRERREPISDGLDHPRWRHRRATSRFSGRAPTTATFR